MKKKIPINKIYSFHSISAPHDFITRIKEEAAHSNLKIEQAENQFDLQIDGNHGGKIVYRANVSAAENGGSIICGEMITIPWSNKPQKKKNVFQKVLLILDYIIILPLVLFVLLGHGIYSLFVRLFHGKNIELSNEEKLCNFMINTMCCKLNKD